MTMTYRGFHYRVTLPLLALCGGLWTLVGAAVSVVVPVVALCGVVVVFTFPWDNWAVHKRLWDFPEDRLLFRIDRLPIEEIAFFVLQTLQVAFLTMSLCALRPLDRVADVDFSQSNLMVMGLSIAVWLTTGVLTKQWRANRRHLRYAWHLFYWFLPVIVLQWMFGYNILIARIPEITIATIAIGGILSIADIWAVRKGIWFFDSSQITGVYVAGILPWEEVAFFFTTSLLVAQSILVLAPASLR